MIHNFIRTSAAAALGALVLMACRPTQRTARDGEDKTGETAQTAPGQPASNTAPGTEQQEDVQTMGLFRIISTHQDYNRIRPWEKVRPGQSSSMGVYIGDGRVLTVGSAASKTTYAEISLPDGSRRVPAKVLKQDEDLNLAVMGVKHAEDASLFDRAKVYKIGTPLSLGSEAASRTLVNGIIPAAFSLVVESTNEGGSIPRFVMRAQGPLPQGTSVGLPVLSGPDTICGLITGVAAETQKVEVTNAEFITRFLQEGEGCRAVPVPGMNLVRLDEPVFRKYLKLSRDEGGLYVSKVEPRSAAEAAGIRKGDVLVSIEGCKLDMLGRCSHPIYGLISARQMIRSLKPNGESLRIGLNRDGKLSEINLPLNRDAVDRVPMGTEKTDTTPQYIIWGGLLFQPLTHDYIENLRAQSGGLPLFFLQLKDKTQELIDREREDVVALTLVIPTPADLGYEGLGFCVVEEVNGTPVKSFAQFAELLDAQTADGITEISINRPPYRIYLDRRTVESSNETLQRSAIPQLRHLTEKK